MCDGGFSWPLRSVLPSLTSLLVPQLETLARRPGSGSSDARRPSWRRSFSRFPVRSLSVLPVVCVDVLAAVSGTWVDAPNRWNCR